MATLGYTKIIGFGSLGDFAVEVMSEGRVDKSIIEKLTQKSIALAIGAHYKGYYLSDRLTVTISEEEGKMCQKVIGGIEVLSETNTTDIDLVPSLKFSFNVLGKKG